MQNVVDLFKTPLPAHVVNGQSKAMQAMAGGLTGGGFGNRISIRNSKFHFLQNGQEVSTISGTLDVVIFAMADNVQRIYYAGAYDPNSKDPPTCFSYDGKAPSDESPKKQSPLCATCAQNVKGSGRLGNTKACAYKKRVAVLSQDDVEGPMYGLDVNAMSMFGDQIEAQNLYSFKGYYEKLTAHNMDIAAIVTRMSFDDKASVPKLHFTPIRALTEAEFAIVQQRQADEDTAKILADVTNVMETDAAPAPAQTKASVKPQGVGGLISSGDPQKNATASTKRPAPKTIEVDLASMVNFDDDGT